jgi:hypothetical protein
MLTCIEARVRNDGLKKTSAMDLPASGFDVSSPFLNLNAESISDSSSPREKSEVLRKFVTTLFSKLLIAHYGFAHK